MYEHELLRYRYVDYLIRKPYAQRGLVEMPPLAVYPSITALADDTGIAAGRQLH